MGGSIVLYTIAVVCVHQKDADLSNASEVEDTGKKGEGDLPWRARYKERGLWEGCHGGHV